MKHLKIFLALLMAFVAVTVGLGQSTAVPSIAKLKSLQTLKKSVPKTVASAVATPDPATPAPESTPPASDPKPEPQRTPPVETKPKVTSETKPDPRLVDIKVKGPSKGWTAFTVGGDEDLSDRAKETKADMTYAGPKSGRLIGIQIADWDLSEVLNSISAQTGVSVVLVSEKNPKVTVRLERMPVEEVVRVLASLTQNAVIGLRGGYVLGPKDVLKSAFPQEYTEQLATLEEDVDQVIEMYACQHVDPAQLAAALEGVYKDDSLRVQVGPGKLRPVGGGSNAGASGGGSSASGSTGAPAPDPSGGGGGTSQGLGRTLVLRGPKAVVRQALALAKRLDQRQAQVSIQVEILDINNDKLNDLGVSWQGNTNVNLTESSPRGINFGSFSRDPIRIGANLRHLETIGAAKILARPNLSLLDQEEGYILIGSRINYPVVTSINDSGQPVFDIKEERVGIYLQVSAAVNDQGEVVLNAYPQVSTITGFLTVNDASYPQISTREARTSMRVASGQTVALGGLISDEEIKTVERVPILSKIPIFGELFTRRKTTNKSSQVVILITPTIEELAK